MLKTQRFSTYVIQAHLKLTTLNVRQYFTLLSLKLYIVAFLKHNSNRISSLNLEFMHLESVLQLKENINISGTGGRKN